MVVSVRRDDGVFPLLTNDRQLTPQEVLAAFKRQPPIEKRFAQLKSDYDIAPVFPETTFAKLPFED